MRTRLAKVLLREGCIRVQRSVFVAQNFSKAEIDELRKRIQKMFKKEAKAHDSVLLMPIEKKYWNKVLLWESDKDDWHKDKDDYLLI